MKRDPEKIRAWQRRSVSLKRCAPPTRLTELNPRNPERREKTFARNFGTRGHAVREMPCLVRGCYQNSHAAHVKGARGMGGANGDRMGLAPLCYGHHMEAGERGTTQRELFEAKYCIDLAVEADRIALELDEKGHE